MSKEKSIDLVNSEHQNDELPANWQQGDISSFETVFKKHYRELYLFAYGYVLNEMEADDIVQDAFSNIWEMRHRLPPQVNIRAYLYTSVKHACLKYFRRLKLTDVYKQRQAEVLLLSFTEESDADDEIINTVKKAMEALTEQQAHILEMHILNGMKYQEIAKELGISENTVRTHLKRAYKIMRAHLGMLIPGIPIFTIL